MQEVEETSLMEKADAEKAHLAALRKPRCSSQPGVCVCVCVCITLSQSLDLFTS